MYGLRSGAGVRPNPYVIESGDWAVRTTLLHRIKILGPISFAQIRCPGVSRYNTNQVNKKPHSSFVSLRPRTHPAQLRSADMVFSSKVNSNDVSRWRPVDNVKAQRTLSNARGAIRPSTARKNVKLSTGRPTRQFATFTRKRNRLHPFLRASPRHLTYTAYI